LNKFESYHSHNGESPVDQEAVLKTVCSPKADQEFESLSLRNGELAEW